ncbi:MAG: hypothetical protein QOJ11_4032 [Frankiales bacterium]|jgi:peptidoglycan/xylan/chitin deacetylase (PgdA/CDA1 family)|nr:hypothetical protein [Frankiales bacterium]
MPSRTSALHHVRVATALAGAVALACSACTSSGKGAAASGTTTSATSTPAAASSTKTVTPTTAKPVISQTPTTPPPAPASVHANELGKVPVLMYHKLTAHPTSDYDRRPSDFTADLTYLQKHGFVPITAADFVAGKIDIPAGKHPVVFTFDDGTVSQFALGADGKPKPGTALALMQAFAATHPDFPAVATFYVNAAPFGTTAGEQVLAYLTAHGDEVGDHTVDHTNLRTATDARVQSEIAGNVAMIVKADPEAKVTTFALPFGAIPKTRVLAHVGSSGGRSYTFAGVFAVGANPAHSPYNAAFDPLYVPRIRAQNQADAKAADRPYISSYWLPQLVANPSSLYVSDGDPSHVSYPKSSTITVGAKWKAMAQPY